MVACGGYVLQIASCVVLVFAAGTSVPLLLLGVVLFGAGFGNATSLPPLIAQVEFVKEDVPRVGARSWRAGEDRLSARMSCSVQFQRISA